MSELESIDFTNMTPASFEEHLPDLFAAAGERRLSEDGRLATFFAANPDCLALVKELETIAETAKSLLELHEPSDAVWSNIASKLQAEPQDAANDLSE